MASTAAGVYNRAKRVALAPLTRKLVVAIVAIVAFIAIAGFLVAPPIIKHLLETRLSADLHRQTTVERVRFNPFTLELTLQGLAVKERNGEGQVMGIDELYGNMSVASLYRLAPVLQQIRVLKPHVRIVRNADKSYNLQDVIDDFLAKPGGGPTPRFSLNNIEVIDAGIDFDDRPAKQEHHVSDVRVGIPFISSLPYAADIYVRPALSGKVDGSPFNVAGQALPFADPRQGTINFDINALELARYLDYVPDVNFKLASGTLDSHLTVSFAAQANQPRTLTVAGTLRVSKLDMRETGGAPVLVLPLLTADIESADLLALEAKVKSIHVEGAKAHVTRRKDSALNLIDLIRHGARAPATPAASQASGSTRAIHYTIGDVELDHGTVYVEDQVPAKPVDVVLENVKLAMHGVSNAPGAKAKGTLSFNTAALGNVEWDGDAQIEPAGAEGTLKLSGLRLDALRPYYESLVNLEFPQGTLDVSTSFNATVHEGNWSMQASSLAASVKGLQMRLPGDKSELARVASLDIRDGTADLAKRVLTVGAITSRDASASIVRGKDGKLNFRGALVAGAKAADSTSAGKGNTPWAITVKHVGLENFGLDYADLSRKAPIKSRISKLALTAEDLSNAKGARGKVNIRAAVNQGGRVSLAGTGSLDPPSANLRVDAGQVDVAAFAPLVEDLLNVALTSGALSAKGTLNVEMPQGAPLKADYQGELDVADLKSVDKATQNPFLNWKHLTFGGVNVRLQPFSAAVDNIRLSDFYARIILNADATFNLQHILKEPSAPPQTVTAPQPKPAVAGEKTQPTGPFGLPASVSIGKITVENGDVSFTDQFIKPNYSADMTGVTGSIGKMTRETAGPVELRGRVQKTAPLEINGSVNAAAPELFLDITGNARDIDLPPLSPYAVKYAGYGITSGKLSMTVKYHLEHRKLEAENRLTLNQLTFGQKVESESATKLPVLLAVSLLKDRNGVINLNLPVSGSLDNPQFSLAGVIGNAFRNLLTKIITAPFALIGSIFGGGGKAAANGEQLSYVEFGPGASAITGDSEKKLQTLAKALSDRPALKLEIVGRADPKRDEEGLRREFLENQVKAEKQKSLGKGAPPLNAIKVEREEYEKYLTAAYRDAKFDKPRNAIGLPKSLPVPEMEQLMLQHAEVTRDDLRQLAEERAKKVRDWLVTRGKVSPDQVSVGAPKVSSQGGKDKGDASRVEFALK